MKYEEWIQYEQKRLSQPDPHAWIALEPALLFSPAIKDTAASPEETPPIWTLIVQVFNSHRI